MRKIFTYYIMTKLAIQPASNLKVKIMPKQEKIATIQARSGYKGAYRAGSARALYAERMAGFVGQPVAEFVASCESECPQHTKKGTAEPIKGWITFLTAENGPFVIS